METFGKVFDGIKFRKGLTLTFCINRDTLTSKVSAGPLLLLLLSQSDSLFCLSLGVLALRHASSMLLPGHVVSTRTIALLPANHRDAPFVAIESRLTTQIDGREAGSVRSRALCESVQTIYLGPDPVAPDAKASFAEGIARMLEE